MLMELLYENASARPDDVAIVYRDERVTHARPGRARRAAGRRPGGPGHRARATPWRCCCRTIPSFIASYFAITGLGAVVVPVNPAFKQDELDFYFRQCDGARRDQRRAQRRRLRADRGRLGAPGPGDHHQLGARPGAHARHADGARAGQARAPLAGRAARLPVLLGLHRPARSGWRAPTASAAARPSTTPAWGSARATASSARSRSSTPTAWAAACSRPRRTGATLVILEDPNPFLLRRQRALELLEQEKATIFPGVPFNFRLMAEAPGLGRPRRRCGSASRPAPRCRGRSSTPSSTSSGCRSASSTAAPRRARSPPTWTRTRWPRSSRSAGPWTACRCASRTTTASRCPPGSIGEVAVQAPGLTNGYADMEELNSQVFREGYFITGDLGQARRRGPAHHHRAARSC